MSTFSPEKSAASFSDRQESDFAARAAPLEERSQPMIVQTDDPKAARPECQRRRGPEIHETP